MSGLSLLFGLKIFFYLLVALLHSYFFILEMFFWTKPLGLRVFGNSFSKAKDSAVLAANQGLYNLFLALGLFISIFQLIKYNDSTEVSEVFLRFSGAQLGQFVLSCVVLAGLYGAYSVSRRIFWIQAFPAILAIILSWL